MLGATMSTFMSSEGAVQGTPPSDDPSTLLSEGDALGTPLLDDPSTLLSKVDTLCTLSLLLNLLLLQMGMLRGSVSVCDCGNGGGG